MEWDRRFRSLFLRAIYPKNGVHAMTKTIAYQGEQGAFSHQAANRWFEHYTPVAYPTFEEAFEAIRTGKADLGMIPVENSLAGRVSDVHHLLPRSNLSIIGERFLPIELVLMASEGTKIDQLTHALSHPMALMQCRHSLARLNILPEISFDTAGSARLISEMKPKNKAAIAPLIAAEIYGLDVLKLGMEDAPNNTTRFLVLSKTSQEAPKEAKAQDETDTSFITSFTFRVRNIPAALYKALGGFATNGVNMTKLESYYEDATFAATFFFCDVEGRPEDAGLKRAFEELSFFATEFTLLGTYPQDSYRSRL